MNRSRLYLEQAAACARRMQAISDPKRRAAIEQELADWHDLAREAAPLLSTDRATLEKAFRRAA